MTQMQKDGGTTWVRGITIGRGSFGLVSLAIARKPNKRLSPFPPVMVVKSAEVSDSYSIQKERQVLTNLSGCPHILHCYGDEVTTEKGRMIYNVLLEYGSGGTLANRIKNSGGGMPEIDVKKYTRSILEGLNHIHSRGYVHGDIKPENILFVPSSCCSSMRKKTHKTQDYIVKIADFGLAKKAQQNKMKIAEEPCLSGTPLYMSPESVLCNIQMPASDIWALGCVVVEMVSGKPAWNCDKDMDADDLLHRIGYTNKLPQTPSQMSKEGKDFLKRCFVRGTMFRWTAEMLLNHPFIASEDGASKESEKVLVVKEVPALSETNNCNRQLKTRKVEEMKEAKVEIGKRRKITSSIAIDKNALKPLTEASSSMRQQRFLGGNLVATSPSNFVISAGV